MPRVLLPTAEPNSDRTLAAAADPLVSQAYVYLFLVVAPLPVHPSENIPLVLLPAAVPKADAALAEPTPLAVLLQHE